MDSNFKRKLIAGLFAPVLGLSVGAALAQSSSGSTTGASGSSATSATGAGSASGATGAGGSAGTTGMGGSAGAGMSGSGAWNAQTFDRLDANKDGVLTREEAQSDPAVRDAWTRLDAKSTGRVNRSDFDKFRSNLGTQSGNIGTTTGSSTSGGGQKVGGSTSGTTGTTK